MAYGLLFLRAIIGTTIAAHGAQKIFGWFGGHGPQGTAGFFGGLGFRALRLMAIVAGLSELAGLLFAVGLLTPFAALAIASVMVVAVGSVHGKNGFWAGSGGFEYNLALWTVAVAIAATGPGRFSIDRLLGWDDNLAGLWWGTGVLCASILGGSLVLATRRTDETVEDEHALDHPIEREREAARDTVHA